jgi:hypothetical protein
MARSMVAASAGRRQPAADRAASATPRALVAAGISAARGAVLTRSGRGGFRTRPEPIRSRA